MAQSIQDGAMPLLGACFDPSTESMDFWDSSKMGEIRESVHKMKPNKKTMNPANAALLWTKSEEAVGKFNLSQIIDGQILWVIVRCFISVEWDSSHN
mmetsp:Transcript_36790/g.41940  ORF Transcript_36790/g.41940 Transcript_36790/m.41940 type:complete len:97 (-) Transcript_36790:136-426(-)|eukprot:CAMPEP_0194162772 /NCGR_PEP_ID=MMETSP0152-20130528/79675_1 /TAXON_ID=1049557 /ORGANISM="Thalassiothrix antarctica, Strain L6-D1" /LENGTH=96 /DNA_ID=CAMNT_0038872697 /DNA_START=854 /DNA_END=1144 /DNA_ORIENTATION=+